LKIKAIILIIVLIILFIFYFWGKTFKSQIFSQINNERAISDVIKEHRQRVESILKPAFAKSGIVYPPQKITLLFFKKEKRLELWAEKENQWVHIKNYPILAASGNSGPKLKEGDRQVPEGIYQIELLNPNSSYHLSMRINYPNEFDLNHAKTDNRQDLGGDIYIHGNSVSIGCLAMGDEASEELFVLAKQVGLQNIHVIIAPYDPRPNDLLSLRKDQPAWLSELYLIISIALKNYPSKL
jgi:murein L,D-transpeptidase YafK